MGVREAVRLEEAVADAGLGQEALLAGHVPALRQPDPLGLPVEVLAVVLHRHLHLRPHRLRDGVHQREEAVGRAAGDDFELARVAMLAERAEEVRRVALTEDGAHARELVDVEAREVAQRTEGPAGGEKVLELLEGERA